MASINDELDALPKQRLHAIDMKGRLLLFPRTGIIGVAFEDSYDGHWRVTVVDGSACRKENGVEGYPRGGHNISVSDREMLTAVELELNEAWGIKVGGWDVPAEDETNARELAELNRVQGHGRPDRTIHLVRAVSFEARTEVLI